MISLLALSLGLQTNLSPGELSSLVDRASAANGKVVVAVGRSDLTVIEGIATVKINDVEEARSKLRRKGWDIQVGETILAIYPASYSRDSFPKHASNRQLGASYGLEDRVALAADGKGSLLIKKSARLLASKLPRMLGKPKMNLNWFCGRTPLIISRGTTSEVEFLRVVSKAIGGKPAKNHRGEHSIVPDGLEFSNRFRSYLVNYLTKPQGSKPSWNDDRKELVLSGWDSVTLSAKAKWVTPTLSSEKLAITLRVKESASPMVRDKFKLFIKRIEDVSNGQSEGSKNLWREIIQKQDHSRDCEVRFYLWSGAESVMMPIRDELPNAYMSL